MPLIFRSKRHEPTPGVARQGTPEQRPVEVAGRCYLSSTEAAYALPKDLQDVPRLDFQHFLLRQAMKGNYLSPISEDVQTILDVGCGTGRWCCEMAHAFPHAQEQQYDLPIGWGGRLGAACLTNLQSFYDALRPGSPAQLQIGRTAVDATWAQLVKEWRQMQSSLRYSVVCGQK